MKGKISDINDLVTQPLKMIGALLYGPNEYRVNKNFDEIYNQLNQNNNEMLEAQQLNSNIILNQDQIDWRLEKSNYKADYLTFQHLKIQ